MKKKEICLILICLILICLIVVFLCNRPKCEAINKKYESEYTQISNKVMASKEIDGGQYEGFRLNVFLKSGKYYSDEHVPLAIGTYPENYEGEYVLQFMNNAYDILDELSLNEDWGYEFVNFPGEFELCVSDYNKDGYPDFVIGSSGSSSMNIYWLYSVDENQRIVRISDEFAHISNSFSFFLEQDIDSDSFYINRWNNALGKNEIIQYNWDAIAFKYLPKL